ncbi:MAG TPA: hypothetical protein VIU40_05045 [Geobacteraceae bacterium]
MKSLKKKSFAALFIVLLPFLLNGCGSGDSTVSTTTVTGSVFAGPAFGATVSVKTSAGAVIAGPVTTRSDGSYSIAIPASAVTSDLVFEASSGTFTDEATATTGVSLGSAALTAYVAGGTLAATSHVTLDPSSTIVQKLVVGGKTKAAAEAIFNTAFGYLPDVSVKPAFANLSSAATTAQRLAGLKAAVFSQLARDLGLAPAKQFELLQALADDLSDGSLDGKKGTAAVLTPSGTPLPEDIGNSYAGSLINFLGSANNKTKLTPAQVNAPSFNPISLTPSYRVQYAPAAGGDSAGKDTFTLKITKRSDGSAATGLASGIVLNPLMVMTSMSGGTTWPNAVAETSTPGTYTGTVYYSMATTGMDMYWKLSVVIGTETAVFYPYAAALPTGNTVSVKFSNGNDTTTGTTKRTYRVWRDSLTARPGGTYDFSVFVSSIDGGNTLPVYAGQSWSTAPLAISTVTLQASTDGTTWVTLSPVGTNTGRYTVNRLALMQGMTMPVYVKLSINGNVYTTNGLAYDNGTGTASNAVQTVSVTP